MANKSIASQTQGQQALQPVGDFGLAEAFGGNGTVAVVQRMSTPYLVFAQPQAKEQWANIMRKFNDIQDGDPVLLFPDPEPMIRPTPLKLTLIAGQTYYATREPNGQELDRFKEQGTCPNHGKRAERVWAAIVVYLADRAVPCTCLFKTVKCPVAQKMVSAMEACQKPEWAAQSDQHKLATAACSSPWARVVGQVTISNKTSRSGKAKGVNYAPADVITGPSTSSEWALLGKLTKDDFAKVAEAYKTRLAELAIK